MGNKIIKVFIPAETEDHGAVVPGQYIIYSLEMETLQLPCRVQSVEMFVFTEVLIYRLTGPDIHWVVWLKLETISVINLVRKCCLVLSLFHLSRIYSYFSGPRMCSRWSGWNI